MTANGHLKALTSIGGIHSEIRRQINSSLSAGLTAGQSPLFN